MAEVEEPLFGGLEAHRVVRVGATVRRPGGPWSPAVQALLRHLQAKGFPAPEPFGLDQRGREIVSFIDGTAGNWPWGEALRRTSGARQIGALLKDYHHAVQDFAPPAQAIWRDGAGSPGPGEIVLHGDFGPYNLIWRNDRLCGVIDWEMAGPGRAVRDAAFAAVQCVPLRPTAQVAQLGFLAGPDRPARLAAFLAGYGAVGVGDLVAEALAGMAVDITKMENRGAMGLEPWATWRRRGLVARETEARSWLERSAAGLIIATRAMG